MPPLQNPKRSHHNITTCTTNSISVCIIICSSAQVNNITDRAEIQNIAEKAEVYSRTCFNVLLQHKLWVYIAAILSVIEEHETPNCP